MTADRPVLGILLMLCFCLMAPVADATAKLLGPAVDLVLLVTIRMAAQVLICGPVAWAMRSAMPKGTRMLRLTFIRAMLHVLGIGTMFLSLRFLPLADAIAIVFVMPFVMLLLGKFILDEEVGRRRIAACAVGFAGTLMVVQPSFAEVGWPALLPLGVAVIFAFFMLVTRQLARETDPVALQFVSGGMAVAVLAPALILFGDRLPGFELAWPALSTWGLLALMGVLGTAAHLVMTWALRFAPSATLAPMQYLEIPVAAVVGWLIFDDFPDGLALAGIGVTILAGLYIIFREQSLARSARTVRTAAPPAA